MRSKWSCLILTLSMMASLTTAKAATPHSTPTGQLQCNEFECVYRPAHMKPADLYREIERAMFGGLGPLEGEFEITTDGTGIALQHPDQTVMEKWKRAVVLYDRLSQAPQLPNFVVSVEAFIVSSSVAKNLSLGLDGVIDAVNSVKLPKVDASFDPVTGSASLTGFIGKIDTNNLRAALGFGKDHDVQTLSERSNCLVENNASIGCSDQTALYNDSVSGTRTTEYAGLRVGGTAHITEEDEAMIELRDLSINYAIPTNDTHSLVRVIQFSGSHYFLKKGQSLAITGSSLSKDDLDKVSSFLGFKRKHEITDSEILVVVSIGEGINTKPIEGRK